MVCFLLWILKRTIYVTINKTPCREYRQTTDMKANNYSRQEQNVFRKMIEDKRAIRLCIQSNGDIRKIADERGIKFATPV